MFRKHAESNTQDTQPGLEVRPNADQQPGLESTNKTMPYSRAGSPAPVFTADAKHGDVPQDYNSSYYAPAAGSPPTSYNEDKEPKGKRILGLRPVTFFLTLALILVIILAAAIGGGVGGAMASKHKSKSTSSNTASSTASPTDSSPPPSDSPSTSTNTTTYGQSSCPSIDNKLRNDGLSGAYKQYCSSYFFTASSDVTNIARGRTVTFDECLEFCDSMDSFGSSKAGVNSVVYRVKAEGSDPVGTCWCTNYADTRVVSNPAFIIAVLDSDVTP